MSLLSFLLVAAVQLLTCGSVAARHINIDVKAEWPRFAASTIIELAEFIGQQKDDAQYWNFVDSMCARSVEADEVIRTANSNEGVVEIQSIAFEAAASVIPPSMHTLMETFLGVGAYAPSVRRNALNCIQNSLPPYI